MQRDMALIRQIMFKLEAEPGGFAPQDLTIEGYPADQVSYHVYLLGQAGLLEVVKNTNLVSSAPSALAVNMTWEGHDFLMPFEATRRGPVQWKERKLSGAP